MGDYQTLFEFSALKVQRFSVNCAFRYLLYPDTVSELRAVLSLATIAVCSPRLKQNISDWR